MSQTDPASELRSYFAGTSFSLEDHPAPEAIAAYSDGETEGEEAALVREHLVQCENCRGLLLELDDLKGMSGPLQDVSEVEIEAAWKRQRQRLPMPPTKGNRGKRVGKLDLERHLGWAVAALLLLTTGGLGLKVQELSKAQARLDASDLPRAVARELGQRGLVDDVPVLILRSDQPGLVLLLLDSGDSDSTFEAEFSTVDGYSLWTRRGLTTTEDLLVVEVPPKILPEGVVRIVVSESSARSQGPAEEYAIRVSYQ